MKIDNKKEYQEPIIEIIETDENIITDSFNSTSTKDGDLLVDHFWD